MVLASATITLAAVYDGETGVGISSVTAYYSTSTSATAPTDNPNIGTWSTEFPDVSDTEYLWMAYLVEYTDGNSSWTEACCLTDGTTRTQLSALSTEFEVLEGKVTSAVQQTDILETSQATGNLIPNGYGTLSSNYNFTNWTFDGSVVYNEKPSFTYTKTSASNWMYMFDELIPVDTAKEYLFSLYAKSTSSIAKYYMGLVEYDVDKNRIQVEHSYAFKASTTTLTQDLNNGDTVVYLTDVSGWTVSSSTATYRLGLIFWGYTDSTGRTYEPGEYSRYTWSNLYTYDNVNFENNTITLTSAWTHGTFKAGTSVSQTNSGSAYKYFCNSEIGTEWIKYSKEFKDIQDNYAGFEQYAFSPATKYIGIAIRLNYNSAETSDVTTYINSVCFTENTVNSSITTLQNQYSEVTQTVSGLTSEVASLTTTVDSNYSTLSSRITTVETTASGISSRVSDVETALGDVTNVSSYVSSEISQLADSISLSVSDGVLGSTASIKLSVNGETTSQDIDLTGVRSAFAADTSEITISAGTVTFNSNTLAVNSDNFTLDSSGNATFGGTLVSPSGTIGGWYIGTDGIYYGTDSMTSETVGTFMGPTGFRQYASDSKFVNIEGGELTAYGATLESATVSGVLTAGAGSTIGGFTIGDSSIYSTANAFGTTSNNVYIGTDGIPLGTAFKVTSAGALTCTSGNVGGFSISSNSIYSSSNAFGTVSNNIYIGSSGISLGTTFKVTTGGVLTATAGSIGGWYLSSTRIKTGSDLAIGSGGAGMLLINETDNGKPFIHCQNDENDRIFQVTFDGDVYIYDSLYMYDKTTLHSRQIFELSDSTLIVGDDGLSVEVFGDMALYDGRFLVYHDYFPQIYIQNGSSSEDSSTGIQICSWSGAEISLRIGSAGYLRGIYDDDNSAWMFYKDSSDVLHIGTSTVGGAAKPMYLSSGAPTACSSTVGSSSKPVYMSSGTITACGTLNVTLTASSGSTGAPVVTSGTDGYKVAVLACRAQASSSTYRTGYYIALSAQWGTTGSTYGTNSIYSAASDIRLKENIADCEITAMETIRAIPVRQFDWKEFGWHQEIGFVADELEELSTNFAVGGGYEEDGSINIKNVNTFYMLGFVVKGMQETDHDLTVVTGRVDSAESQLKAMSVKLDAAYDEIASLKKQLETLQASA